MLNDLFSSLEYRVLSVISLAHWSTECSVISLAHWSTECSVEYRVPSDLFYSL